MMILVQIASSYTLDIHIDKLFWRQVQEEWLRQTAEEVFASEEICYPVQLSIVVTDDKTVRQLNHTYRKLDETTDVLAFAFEEDGKVFFPQPSNEGWHLGEVIISCPQAERQAEEQGHQLEKEIALLVIHGVLHLLGYDHEEPEEESKMRTKEKEVLAQVMEKRQSL